MLPPCDGPLKIQTDKAKVPDATPSHASTGGRGRSVRISGMNVLYDEASNEYLVDDASQLYVPLGAKQTVAEGEIEVENIKETKN